jgi:hypothetical protein
MFVAVTLACVGIGVRGFWTPRWVHERRNFLHELALDWDDAPAEMRKLRWGQTPDVAASANLGDRFTLWFFKEPAQAKIKIPVVTGSRKVDNLRSDPKVQRAARLFPEADVCGIPLPWLPVLGPRLAGESTGAKRTPASPLSLPKLSLP